MNTPPLVEESVWQRWHDSWSLDPEVTYLNHGSFGPSPTVVLEALTHWTERLERQPMRFFIRQLPDLLEQAYLPIAELLNCSPEELVFVDNATVGMNIVAGSVPLAAGDEVLMTDHDYGAVIRIWQRVCDRVGARLVVHPWPISPESGQELVESLLRKVSPKTRLLVISHITSPTALRLPVELITQRAKQAGLTVCVDGPHAPGAVPVDLGSLACDFYTASCHKWLCGPFGSGFLFVRDEWRHRLQPSVLSWGRPLTERGRCWKDELHWIGTRNPASFLAVPTALQFLRQVGWPTFREYASSLANYARWRLGRDCGLLANSQDSSATMVAFPLPTGLEESLARRLWETSRLEVPVMTCGSSKLLRVSCHLYNRLADIDKLSMALQQELG